MTAATPSGAGVLYVATGASHVAAARAAAASVRRSNPGLAVALFTDAADPGPEFHRVLPVQDPRARSKVDALWRTPFERTLYLDTDTRVRGDLSDLFDVLQRFELAIAQRAYVRATRSRAIWRHVVPAAFPEHNSGVILYRSSPAALRFLTAWRAAYAEAGFGVDQITLRELLWATDLRVAVLPPRYNRRRWSWLETWFLRQPPPLILHTNRLHPTRYGPLRRKLAWVEGPSRSTRST